MLVCAWRIPVHELPSLQDLPLPFDAVSTHNRIDLFVPLGHLLSLPGMLPDKPAMMEDYVSALADAAAVRPSTGPATSSLSADSASSGHRRLRLPELPGDRKARATNHSFAGTSAAPSVA